MTGNSSEQPRTTLPDLPVEPGPERELETEEAEGVKGGMISLGGAGALKPGLALIDDWPDGPDPGEKGE